ncbi:MAG: hypothetical protein WKF75_17020 [Singulisphaera sp.]
MTRLGKALGWGSSPSSAPAWSTRAPHRPEAERGHARSPGRGPARLLRQFRAGTSNALRRALPLGEPTEFRGAVPYSGDQLPPGDLSYDLKRLLEDSTGGLWRGGHDVMAELGREYRKAAEEAMRRGDFRRAASVYGKLLRDFRAAANALMRGGLHHDAAVLLLARLDDRRGAARAFEAAGEVDRAVQLYRQGHEHEEAGDLLRRVGRKTPRAEYLAAADRLAGTFDGHLAAGDLLLAKAGRPDLALAHFAAGWSRRPLGNAIPCVLRIARIHAERGEAEALRALVDQADATFETSSRPRCGPFLQRGGRARRSPRDGRCGRSSETGRCWGSPPSSAAAPARGRRRWGSPRSSWDRKAAGPPRSSATRASPSRPRRNGPPRTIRGHPPTSRSGISASDPGSSARWPRHRDRARSSSASRGARSSASGPRDPKSSAWPLMTCL